MGAGTRTAAAAAAAAAAGFTAWATSAMAGFATVPPVVAAHNCGPCRQGPAISAPLATGAHAHDERERAAVADATPLHCALAFLVLPLLCAQGVPHSTAPRAGCRDLHIQLFG